MSIKFSKIFFICLLLLAVSVPILVWAQDEQCQEASTDKKLEINFFYSKTCSHCQAEEKFLDEIESKYPQVKINRYLNNDPQSRPLLEALVSIHKIQRLIGLVPLTFVGNKFFLGFDNQENMGRKIEESIQRQLADLQPEEPSDKNDKISLPLIGEVDIKKFSLPAQAVILGFFDGFNVCSLGALVLILGLVISLKSRRRIFIFGSIFILTTALVYGLLIVLWYKLFSFLASYLRLMEIIIGLLGIGGGIYFIREFIKFRRRGPTCEQKAGQNLVAKFSKKIQRTLQNSKSIFLIIGSILVFAGLIAIVEFPCSAAIPVFFAGTLAQAGLNSLAYLLYIVIFLFFYMLDEIAVFVIALATMKIRLASPRFVVWLTLVEAIVLFILGFYYLIGF